MRRHFDAKQKSKSFTLCLIVSDCMVYPDPKILKKASFILLFVAPKYLSNLKFLYTLQSTNSTVHSNGGFYEEFYKSIFNWKKRLRVNSWASMFALQSFFWHEQISKIDFDREIKFLY